MLYSFFSPTWTYAALHLKIYIWEARVEALNILCILDCNYFHSMCWKYFVSLTIFLCIDGTRQASPAIGVCFLAGCFLLTHVSCYCLVLGVRPGTKKKSLTCESVPNSDFQTPLEASWSQVIFSQQPYPYPGFSLVYIIQMSSGQRSGFWSSLSHQQANDATKTLD